MDKKQVAKDIFKIVSRVDSREKKEVIDFMKIYCEATIKNEIMQNIKSRIRQFFYEKRLEKELYFYVNESDGFYFIHTHDFGSYEYNHNGVQEEIVENFISLLDNEHMILQYFYNHDISSIHPKKIDITFENFLTPEEKTILSLVENSEKNELESVIEKKDRKPIVKV